MSFETRTRILAVPANMVEPLFVQLRDQHGEELPDGSNLIRTIGGNWDDTEHTRIRAATFPTTITGQPLTDGRIAFVALWQADLSAEYDAGAFPMVEELTPERLAELTPQPLEIQE